MKTFLNVLYRRILYKIPLKFLLVILAIVSVFIACTKADNVDSLINYIKQENITINSYSSYSLLSNINSSDYGTYCIRINSLNRFAVLYAFNGDTSDPSGKPLQYLGVYSNWGGGHTVCLYVNLSNLYLYNSYDSSVNVNYSLYKLDTLLNTQLPVYSSMQCQTEYNLIPIEEVNSSYCQSNNLCPSGGTPSDCPNVGVSNLFINDIFHPGAFNIIMNIPEEIDWDYAYTNSGYNFNLDVVGYNVDYEKIQTIVDNQHWIPSQEDFNSLISVLVPYTNIIIIFVVIFLVWAWVKKPFKSKKL